MTTPTPSALSAADQQLQESQKTQACPKARPNRRLHRSAAPPSPEGHCTGARPSGLFFWTVHCAAVGGFAALRMRRTPCGCGPFSFRARPIRGPRRAPRGGERRSVQAHGVGAEVPLGCKGADAVFAAGGNGGERTLRRRHGGCIPLDKPPCGSRILRGRRPAAQISPGGW